MGDLNSRHHLLFPRAEWMLRKEARFIRTTPSLIPHMSREDHDLMHTTVPIVPALGHKTLMCAVGLWTPENNTMRDIDSLCVALGKAAVHEKSHPIETDLAELTIEALQLQVAVLKEVEFR